MATNLLKEDLSLLKDVLQLNQVQEVPLQSLLVGVDFLHLHFQGLEPRLQDREIMDLPNPHPHTPLSQSSSEDLGPPHSLLVLAQYRP